MQQIYSEIGLIHADDEDAPVRPEPRTVDEVIGHPTPITMADDDTRGTSHTSIDREIFGFLVSP